MALIASSTPAPSTLARGTELVCLSHVAFKSGHLHDAAAITQHAHQTGALVLCNPGHSVGVIPVELDARA